MDKTFTIYVVNFLKIAICCHKIIRYYASLYYLGYNTEKLSVNNLLD